MLANMINSLLGDYSSKINEKNERYIDKKRDNEK